MKITNFIKKIGRNTKDAWIKLSETPSDKNNIKGSLLFNLKKFLISYPRFFVTVFIYTIVPFILAFVIYLFLISGKPSVTVPQLQGLSMIDAANLLQVNKLRPTYLTIDSDEYPNYFIVSQDIKAGRKVKAGRDIILYVSETGNIHQFPNYKGKRIFLIQNTLQQTDKNIQKVFIETIEWLDSDKPYGEIIEQNPQSGSYKEFPIGISFTVSKGKQTIMPDFQDQFIGEALFYTNNNNIKTIINTKDVKDPQLAGKILSQTPKEGQAINDKSYIYFIVGQYKNNSQQFFYTVPNALHDQKIEITLKDNRGERILFQGQVKKGEILFPSSQIYGNFNVSVYLIKDGNKEFFKDLTQ